MIPVVTTSFQANNEDGMNRYFEKIRKRAKWVRGEVHRVLLTLGVVVFLYLGWLFFFGVGSIHVDLDSGEYPDLSRYSFPDDFLPRFIKPDRLYHVTLVSKNHDWEYTYICDSSVFVHEEGTAALNYATMWSPDMRSRDAIALAKTLMTDLNYGDYAMAKLNQWAKDERIHGIATAAFELSQTSVEPLSTVAIRNSYDKKQPWTVRFTIYVPESNEVDQ